MSLLSSFKKALGFPDEYEDFNDEESEPEHDTSSDPTPAAPATIAPVPVSEELEEADSALPGQVFDAVIELFNASQPEFVSSCLNTEAQRQYLLERIGDSLRQSLKAESERARAHGQRLWENERAQMADDLEKLKTEYYSLRQQREEFKSAQLSAARQKRALSERVHDLESQVNSLEADREQLQLENRSMLNKLRVASVKAADAGTPEAEIHRLAEENVKLQDTVNGLRDDLKARDAEIAELKKANSELAENAATDTFTPEQQEAMAEIERRIEEFEVVKQRKDDKIKELTESLRTIKRKLGTAEQTAEKAVATEAELRAEVDRLTAMITAAAEKEQRTEAPAVEKVEEQPQNPKPRKKHRNKKRNEPKDEEKTQQPVKISAIDELMDSTDWFTVPEPMPIKKDPEVEEEFGYKEPAKKPVHHDDDKQLSLF